MNHYATLHTHTESGVHTILLNRPEKRNALTPQLIDDLIQALEAAVANPRCHVVILSGAGSAFCAGLDLEQLRAIGESAPPPSSPTASFLWVEEQQEDAARIANLLRTLYHLPMPTIAAVNGPAIAGGMGIATLCDFTLAVPEAKFGYTEVRIGFVPAIVAAFLRDQIGDKRSRDLLLTGRILSAEEALAIGLITRIVPEPDLMMEARALAAQLLRNSPAAMASTKRLLSEFANRHLPDNVEAAILVNAQARATEDFREGVRAFLDKRDPQWPSLRQSKEPAHRE